MKSRNWGCRVSTDISISGFQAVVLENRRLRVTVLADKGTDIVELLYKPLDIDLLCQTPNGLRHRGELPTKAAVTGSFFDNYEGGWQEIFPSAGPPCVYRGAEMGQHGEVCLLPWGFRVLRDDEHEVSVEFQVDCLRTPFRIKKTLSLRGDEPTLHVEESVTNLSPLELDYMWGHHPAYGYPFIDHGTQLLLDDCEIRVPEEKIFQEQRIEAGFRGDWPFARGVKGEKVDLSRVPPRGAASSDFCFLFPEIGRYRIFNQELGLEARLEWDHRVLPRLWFWQVCNGGAEWPWWGRLYCQALEPHSSAAWTLNRAIETGESALVAAGESVALGLTLTVSGTSAPRGKGRA